MVSRLFFIVIIVMRNFILSLFLLLPTLAFGQDVIKKNDSSVIVCRIVKIDSTEVICKKWPEQDSATFVVNLKDVNWLKYESGRTIDLNPNAARTDTDFYNRAQTYRMNLREEALSKAKRLKIIGWVVGPVAAAAGAVLVAHGEDATLASGVNLIAGGIATTTTCLLLARSARRGAEQYVTSTPLFNNEFTFGNNTKLTSSIDLMNDSHFKTRTLGIGLRYSF